jgi:carbon storage regulator
MLILSRKKGETVHIGDSVTVTVLESRGNRVWIGLNAPQSVRILRQEVLERDDREAKAAEERALAAGNRLSTCL